MKKKAHKRTLFNIQIHEETANTPVKWLCTSLSCFRYVQRKLTFTFTFKC